MIVLCLVERILLIDECTFCKQTKHKKQTKQQTNKQNTKNKQNNKQTNKTKTKQNKNKNSYIKLTPILAWLQIWSTINLWIPYFTPWVCFPVHSFPQEIVMYRNLSTFVFLSLLAWPLCCLLFDFRLLITHLVCPSFLNKVIVLDSIQIHVISYTRVIGIAKYRRKNDKTWCILRKKFRLWMI